MPVAWQVRSGLFIENTKEGDLLSRDGLHQNDLGYRCMAACRTPRTWQ
jgi:hypothetical protein